MTIGAHTIKPAVGAHKRSKRLGRGNATQKGTTAGRGMKGQRARSGGKAGTKYMGFKRARQQVAKLRGFTSLSPKAQTVTLFTINRVVVDAVEVTPTFLREKNVIADIRRPVKIVATGELTKKVTIRGCFATKQAVVNIEKLGGSIVF